ncbi:glycosyltransferase family 1 protein [Alteromonas sediminis]|uniref:Glycosyltransferase family 1 protein n=1 Tax=Alteromonas sediminis TaxID=2259342 RepID=A0A3N5Y1N3_9ALTE|nr:glycosyltransferase family 1 protein [Alteromonas sediminis]RPJ66456.1 glycosyltransferase family 1 protein [Alteromonas sediminis]
MKWLKKVRHLVKPKIRMLFCRDYQGYTGGHQKYYDYYQHISTHPAFSTFLHFSDASFRDASCPWSPEEMAQSVDFNTTEYDALFVAGTDWRNVPEDDTTPVINLIQHVRHAEPNTELYSYLSRPAMRLCVSAEVEQAIRKTGNVNGPIITVPNGHNIDVKSTDTQYSNTLFILGMKQPTLCNELEKMLFSSMYEVIACPKKIPREDVLSIMGNTKISVLLPDPTEGYYLPALEAMANSAVALVPDCVGNRTFCKHLYNCMMPKSYTAEGILQCIDDYERLSEEKKREIQLNARATALSNSIDKERTRVHELLDNWLKESHHAN